MEHTTIAVDRAKSVFQVAVSHRPGRVDDERRLTRERFLRFFAQQPPATIVLEACGSAHYWARQLQPFGQTVRLLPPHDVRRYVRRNKTDRTDAKALLEANMRAVDRQLTSLVRQPPDVTLLQTVAGVGVLTATALVALVGDIRRFRSGRHFASFLGLTPKEDSSAGRRRLGAISKQGDVYVRMLLTHGARSFVWHAKTAAPPTSLQRWAVQTEQRRGHNVATVAVANNLARIVWAVWVQQRPFAAEHRPG